MLFLERLLEVLRWIGKFCAYLGGKQLCSLLGSNDVRTELCFKQISSKANVLGNDSLFYLHTLIKLIILRFSQINRTLLKMRYSVGLGLQNIL
jgi:hypothetical protein